MDGDGRTDAAAGESRTIAERASEGELVVTRRFKVPAAQLFEAWTKPELFRQWWVPKSCGLTLLECEMDACTGGSYRLVFRHPSSGEPMPFFGRYREVMPPSRLVWTNDEGGGGGAVTTVTFEERGGATLLTMRDVYASKEALDDAIASGATGTFSETFEQLDAILPDLNGR